MDQVHLRESVIETPMEMRRLHCKNNPVNTNGPLIRAVDLPGDKIIYNHIKDHFQHSRHHRDIEDVKWLVCSSFKFEHEIVTMESDYIVVCLFKNVNGSAFFRV